VTPADNTPAGDTPADGTEHVRVELVRTGGFGGMELRGTLDTAQLPRPDAEDLAGLVEQVDFDSFGHGGAAGDEAATGTRRAVPDAFQYRLSVQRGGRRWSAVFDESQVPPELRPLLAKLVARGRAGRAGGPP
jgi:hypothetical protein